MSCIVLNFSYILTNDFHELLRGSYYHYVHFKNKGLEDSESLNELSRNICKWPRENMNAHNLAP